MPRATVNLEPGEKKPLKTLPDGWVVLRRMSYGQKLNRLRLVGKMSVEMKKNAKSTRGEMEMAQRAATLYDFQTCIVEHNLEDDTGRTLNMSTERDVDSLDPRIGEEISVLIDELNNFEAEEDDEEGNSLAAFGPQ